MIYDYSVDFSGKEYVFSVDQRMTDEPFKQFGELFDALSEQGRLGDECHKEAPVEEIPRLTEVKKLISKGAGIVWNCSRSTL